MVYPAAAAIAPGVIHHVEGDRFPIGELDGKETERVKELHDVFIKAGLKSLVLPDIRSEIWLKAWGNLSFNPISALTHATLVDICQFAETRELAATMMKEAQDIAQKLGVTFRVTIDKRIAGAEAVGAHKTSMLQDVEAGRSLETEALIGSILEMAKLTNTPAPAIEVRLRAGQAAQQGDAAGRRRREGGEGEQGGVTGSALGRRASDASAPATAAAPAAPRRTPETGRG